ncbi:MAG: TonB-dependent receptor, partial [Halioglobus sp.]|nr:TonB-dependent receptor [Halioglobus sp.]
MSTQIRHSVAVALSVYLFPSLSLAQPGSTASAPVAHEHDLLEEIVVTANPLGQTSDDLSQSVTVLQGEALRQQLANSLGETLARTPGIANASFGENVGRPVIRGLQGTRVGVLSNSMAVADASSLSQDHAVSVEPFLVDQIEVLRGPSTLLYGSGAIGGVVNMVSPTIPQAIPENGYSGRATAEGNTAADEEFAAGRLDLGSGQFALHVDGFHRRTDDYDIPGNANLYPEDDHEDHEGEDHDEHEEHDSGTLDNSYLKNHGWTVGGSWIGEQWLVGLAYTDYRSEYGIPGDAHVHEHEEDHDEEHEDEHEEEHEEEEAPVSIDLKSQRTEVEIAGRDPLPGFEQIKLRYVDTQYEHTEYEGREVGTVFNSDTDNSRLELKHDRWGIWQGAFGLQYTEVNFSAKGAEAFVPTSKTDTTGAFWIERADMDEWQFDLGMRYEDVQSKVPNTLIAEEGETGPKANVDYQPFSASAGVLWQATDIFGLSFSAAHAERAPAPEELFANGPHIATQVFEVGDASLDKEKNLHLEAGVSVTVAGLTGSANVYYDDFDNYIYLSDTGEEQDGLPVQLWQQQGADFIGGEIELRYDFDPGRYGHWQVFGFGDIVDGELSDNTDVPLAPPARIGMGLDWDHAGFAANLLWIHAYKQDNTAPLETPTPGYDLLNAEVSYSVVTGEQLEFQVYLQGQNL